MASEHVLGLEACSNDCRAVVGGKAAGLGSMLRQGLQVPPGFAVTTAAYRQHVAHNGMAADLERLIADCGTYDAQVRASEQVRELFERSTPPPVVEAEIRRAYAEVCDDPHLPVAVRSSATAEDMADASFAGQQETFLWIIGADEVLRHVLRCWSSLFTPQAIAYRARLGVPATDLAMGVVVQRMVPAEAAGVMLTIDPINGDASSIVIEAAFGLGAAVVNGEVEPDRFCIDKRTLRVRSRSTGVKTVAYRFDASVQGTTRTEVPADLQEKACVSDAEMIALAQLGVRMEQAMGSAQDIEWAIGPDREMYMLQARPETVWSQLHAS